MELDFLKLAPERICIDKARPVAFALLRLRGGLDVPKERFVSFPHCARDADGSLPVLWAGYDHLARAKAIAAWYRP